jgi:hypothetical protein
MGAAGVKYGDTGGGTTEASGMPDCTRMASVMVGAIGIIEDRGEISESSWMSSGIAEAIGISEAEAVEMNEAIVMPRACWVVGAIGLAQASWILGGMSISSKKIIGIQKKPCYLVSHLTIKQ